RRTPSSAAAARQPNHNAARNQPAGRRRLQRRGTHPWPSFRGTPLRNHLQPPSGGAPRGSSPGCTPFSSGADLTPRPPAPPPPPPQGPDSPPPPPPRQPRRLPQGGRPLPRRPGRRLRVPVRLVVAGRPLRAGEDLLRPRARPVHESDPRRQGQDRPHRRP